MKLQVGFGQKMAMKRWHLFPKIASWVRTKNGNEIFDGICKLGSFFQYLTFSYFMLLFIHVPSHVHVFSHCDFPTVDLRFSSPLPVRFATPPSCDLRIFPRLFPPIFRVLFRVCGVIFKCDVVLQFGVILKCDVNE